MLNWLVPFVVAACFCPWAEGQDSAIISRWPNDPLEYPSFGAIDLIPDPVEKPDVGGREQRPRPDNKDSARTSSSLPEAPVLVPPLPEAPSNASNAGAPSPMFPSAEVGTHQFGPEYPLLQGGWLDQFGAQVEEYKRENHCPITVSAWHWFHINTGGPNASGYGIPSTEYGTYYYGIEANPEFDIDFGSFTKAGAYADVRFRDGDRFRPYYPGDAWAYQAYTWAYADPAVLKAGLIWRRFGMDWDGSFWGNTAYYDGFMLATGWGLSWEVTPEMKNGWKVDQYYQFFFRDYLDGSIVGADPTSVVGSAERNVGVARVVPTVQLSCKEETLALGLSGMAGTIDNEPLLSLAGIPGVFYPGGDNLGFGAWAADLTYTNHNFKTFVQGLQSYGTLSPARYVSLGPSNRITDMLMGFNWVHGPITYRFTYSLGLDSDPSGTQQLFVPGITVALTKNVELYVEYVNQQVLHSGDDRFNVFENGVQVVLHWRF